MCSTKYSKMLLRICTKVVFPTLFKHFPVQRPVHARLLCFHCSFKKFQPCLSSQHAQRTFSKAKRPHKDSKKAKNIDEGNTEDYGELEDEENYEVLQQLRDETGLEEGHSVLVIQPDFKWGRNRFHLETLDHMLGEALGLVESLKHWKVIEGRTEPIRKPDARYFFGKGKLEELTKYLNVLKKEQELTAVFLDVAKLTRRQYVELEELWKVKVFDRFSLILQIFKERAVTSEAKIQVELAELGYIRSRLTLEEYNSYDQQRGGTYSMGGAGETHIEVAKRMLGRRQQKLKKKLEGVKKQRDLIRHDRAKRNIPVVSVVGYTNAGKTTLIKALTHDSEMQPDDKLFSTLDVTVHKGKLPCGLTALFIDTIGFVSDLPHELVESFSATLEDVVHSDLLIHVCDISHPEFAAQKVHVYDVLKLLKLPKFLMENIVEVHNKMDIRGVPAEDDVTGYSEISALYETGLDDLRHVLQDTLLKTTGRHIKSIKIPQGGPQLSWLHHEATVSEIETTKDGRLSVKVIMDEAALGRYSAKFGKID